MALPSPSRSDGVQSRQNRSLSLLASLKGSLSMPSAVSLYGVSAPISDETPPKQRWLSCIGGVPDRKSTSISCLIDVGEGFNWGLYICSLIMSSQLGVSPDRWSSTATVRVGEISGPSILPRLLQEVISAGIAIWNR